MHSFSLPRDVDASAHHSVPTRTLPVFSEAPERAEDAHMPSGPPHLASSGSQHPFPLQNVRLLSAPEVKIPIGVLQVGLGDFLEHSWLQTGEFSLSILHLSFQCAWSSLWNCLFFTDLFLFLAYTQLRAVHMKRLPGYYN